VSCDKKTQQVVLVEQMKDASPKDVADELPEAMPRLILHRHAVEIEAGVAPRDFLFYIHYNPFDCPADMKRLYASARDLVLDKYTELKVCTLNIHVDS